MKLIKFILGVAILVGVMFFNGWFWECVYNIGICPLFDHFGHELPQVEYRYFVFLGILLSTCYVPFKPKSKKKEDEDIVDGLGIYDKDVAEILVTCARVVESLVNELLALFMLWVVYITIF
jgi:hypothetical protein